MKYINENTFYTKGRDEFKIMVSFPDKDAIYLECTKEEIGNREAVINFSKENNVQYEEFRIFGYKINKTNNG